MDNTSQINSIEDLYQMEYDEEVKDGFIGQSYTINVNLMNL